MSAARAVAPSVAATTYTPFSLAVAWSFSSTRSLVASVTPSITSPSFSVLMSTLSVDATRTSCFRSTPSTRASTYALLAASLSVAGAARFTTLNELPMSRSAACVPREVTLGCAAVLSVPATSPLLPYTTALSFTTVLPAAPSSRFSSAAELVTSVPPNCSPFDAPSWLATFRSFAPWAMVKPLRLPTLVTLGCAAVLSVPATSPLLPYTTALSFTTVLPAAPSSRFSSAAELVTSVPPSFSPLLPSWLATSRSLAPSAMVVPCSTVSPAATFTAVWPVVPVTSTRLPLVCVVLLLTVSAPPEALAGSSDAVLLTCAPVARFKEYPDAEPPVAGSCVTLVPDRRRPAVVPSEARVEMDPT